MIQNLINMLTISTFVFFDWPPSGLPPSRYIVIRIFKASINMVQACSLLVLLINLVGYIASGDPGEASRRKANMINAAISFILSTVIYIGIRAALTATG